ncbi:signal peptidase I [Carnobacterium divergens]|uniref:Signal peptidase I n=1 Tax=Carnobacterium divergens TaxID=2748 RepID=A0A2R8A0Y9_CARDV|nr:signal peptidase I [Carnobacterium divergens]MCO6017762.1 signal peptidase I [Carnobacterium divergens]MPQ21369.1 signal peptidase I [Carnobacterium divergens]TFI60820.1 signal peptidase I [Carnobacterium divergens]TFI71409.1 signal peptidase I [Carnobacterium divergens]TFI76051.1 signal peptidase I [Carnobacterium divergens]
MEKSWRDHLWDWFKAAVLAIVLTAILRNFIFIPMNVQGSSMIPTLHQGDQMVVESFSKIQRFDIVVFKDASNRTLVKRIIGLPGESIAYRNDQLYIDNHKISEPFLKNKLVMQAGETWTSDFDLQQLTGEETVPANEYFVLGDNRRSSNDSRVFGSVAKEEIIGKTILVYFPFNRINVY